MATKRATTRLQVGSSGWISEERSCAAKMAENEAEEFMFSARNEVDWLNEHMAEIFSENQVNVAEIFKTPGKLRGKTPRTGRKANPLEMRAPLSDVFSSTPRGAPSPFKQLHFEKPVATFQVAEDIPSQLEEASSSNVFAAPETLSVKNGANGTNFLDSGFFGSQATEFTQATQPNDPFIESTQHNSTPRRVVEVQADIPEELEEDREVEERRSTEGSFQSAKEEQTRQVVVEPFQEESISPAHGLETSAPPVLESPLQHRIPPSASPQKRSPERLAAMVKSPLSSVEQAEEEVEDNEDEPMEDAQSPQSDNSSPIRPVVRKSSLNFASLPAREPLTSKKSIGNRVSRTSHLDQSRTSYYGRNNGGKSTGTLHQDDDVDDMDVNDQNEENPVRDEAARLHNKTSTQRLQDQISMLGKSQTARPSSKSFTANNVLASFQAGRPSQSISHDENQYQTSPARSPVKSPLRKERPPPGAFPEDEEDSWIGPPNAAVAAAAPPSIFSPRPQVTKSHTTDVMEEIHGKDTISAPHFSIPKRGEDQRPRSPVREPVVPERTISTFGHIKSVSTSVLRSPRKAGETIENQFVSVSNPTPSVAATESTTPPKSPSRSRGSPLKAAKDKFSSILKTSRGLFASSAAVSAEAKSTLSPPISRMGFQNAPSMASLLEQPLYPDLTLSKTQSHTSANSDSPARNARNTRASTERAEKRKMEEARDAQKMNDQLDKARQKVKDDARVFHLEQERVASMQKEIASKKEEERVAQESQVDLPRATRSSPRKTKAQLEAEGIAAAAQSSDDVEMSDVPASMAPPAIPTAKSQIGRPAAKRPMRPGKDTQSKSKPPTVIRVDTGSQRGHQYHPSNSALAASLQDSLSNSQASSSQSSQGTLRHKASTSSIQSKASTASFKSGATKALEAAARKKEQDELNAQKKREAKAEIERQRAAIKEEERRKDEQQRRQEAERQREIQREREKVTAAADAKKAAARQAMEKRRLEMEKAKETRPPPPAIRPQAREDLQEKALPPLPQAKPARMNPIVPRPQEEAVRPGTSMQNSAKAPPKRPLQQDNDEYQSRPAVQRNGPSYQQNDANSKRRKTSENFEDDEDLTENHPKMTAPPIRQSTARPKEFVTKSLFPSGYASTGTAQRNTLVSQHNNNQSKAAHPLDMTQVSKAPIAFASGSNQQNGQSYKTPARAAQTAGKSAAKSAKASPRYQAGESIVLPEVVTDSEDEDEDEKPKGPVLAWANSPAIRDQLMKQEGMDPTDIFGGRVDLDMEAVFNKSKDKFHKFRARTSSANWSGEDRLTQDEIRKDVEARDKLRRQGFWTFDHMV